LSELQKLFANEIKSLRQKYVCLWEKEQIDEWLETQRLSRKSS